MTENGPPETPVSIVNTITTPECDGIVLVTTPEYKDIPEELKYVITEASTLDEAFGSESTILPLPNLPSKRLIYLSTGKIDPDYDDARTFKTAGKNVIGRALKAGVKKPLVILLSYPDHPKVDLVFLLGVLEALYVPIQVREFNPLRKDPIDCLYVYHTNPEHGKAVINTALALERGRRVACDIGDADPERMTPVAIELYIRSLFADGSIHINFIEDIEEIARDYPLFEAVNRAASDVERHRGRIAFLEYNPPGEGVKDTYLFVGKGVTYDTGGMDVKAGGVMAGMSRDKCGAAAVVGLFAVLQVLKPKYVRVIGGLGLVRNSIGPNGYVADEVITARSGKRVRVVNTDAEGRMIMADILCKFKEIALNAVNPHLFTVATLTGHACLAVGEGYSIAIDNGPAKKASISQRLQLAGELIGDPFETSILRKEDLNFHRGQAVGDDIVQSNNLPSSRTPRGHQGPAAFLLLASGLDSYGSGSAQPIKYSHLDIAAAAGEFPKPGTGAPVLALSTFLKLFS